MHKRKQFSSFVTDNADKSVILPLTCKVKSLIQSYLRVYRYGRSSRLKSPGSLLNLKVF